MTEYEKMTLMLQAAVAVVAFLSLVFLYRQVSSMGTQIAATQEASRAQSALAIVTFLQSADARVARQCVRSTLSQKHHRDWSDDEKHLASAVCANYDVAAGLLKAGLAPLNLITVNWGPSILHCHEVLSPYMSEVRSKPGGHPEYWKNFDWLRMEAARAKE